ncbi:hypothetical protein DRP04_15605 [Archaeoglobales archaeon]|nr:MAG: hypothetical protein DRN46_03835 [Thermococci archaeon]RLI73582.1 MAG: hypothetical protein DRP04_15605 [Archaeoglobales archaeon]
MFDWNGRLGLFSRSRHASIGTYSRIYDFVKVNSTFYVLPSLSRAEHWRKNCSRGFLNLRSDAIG